MPKPCTGLNEWTSERIRFYGIKVEVVKKAGDAEPEPRLRKVVYPGGWNKDITQQPGQTESPDVRNHREFFQPLVNELIDTGFADKATQGYDSRERFFPSRLYSGIRYGASFWKNAAWVTLYIGMEDKERTKRIFDELERDQTQIEPCIEGEDWRWHRETLPTPA